MTPYRSAARPGPCNHSYHRVWRIVPFFHWACYRCGHEPNWLYQEYLDTLDEWKYLWPRFARKFR